MRKLLTTFVLLLVVIALQAAPVKNLPVQRIQPNGDTLRCLVSGDEFFHRLHDEQGYTIVLNPQTGWYVYARVLQGQLVPSQYVPGAVNPAQVGLQPNAIPCAEELQKRHRAWDIPEPYQQPAPKTSGRNHGTLNNVVIFIRFSDESQCCNETLTQINTKFNDSSANAVSLYSYFKYTSYNKLRVITHFFPGSTSDTVQSYQDSHPRGYYKPYSATNTDGYTTDSERSSREFTLLENAATWVNNNGLVPTSLDLDMDNDGKIDNVCFVVSGETDGWNDLLWPHKWSLYDRTVNINGKRVYTFNFQLAGSGDHYFGVSTLCHEMTHTLGAPDLYHYDNYTSVSAAGSWDLMHSNSTPPQQTNTLFKMNYLNWIDSIPTIVDSGSYTMYSLGSGPNNAYKIASPNPHQWYILEYRNANDRFDASIPNSGMLVWRYNDLSSANNASFDNGAHPHLMWLFRPGSPNDTTSGTIASASFGVNGRSSFDPSSNPHPYLSNGLADTSFSITNIAVSANQQYVTFTFAPRQIDNSCDSVSRFPHLQDFEMGDLQCWTFHSNNAANDTGTSNGAGITTSTVHSGGFAFRFSSWNRASDYNQYLVSPRLAHDDTLLLSFFYRKYNDNQENLTLKYSTTTADISAFTHTLWTPDSLTTSYRQALVELPPDVKYLAFCYQANYQYHVFLDDISITRPCNRIRQYPHTQGFEDGLQCWSFVSNNAANDLNAATNAAQIYADSVHSGSYCLRFSSYRTATDYNQYLISPRLVHTDSLRLTFYYKKYNSSVENLYVKYSTTTDDPSAFTYTLWTGTNISTVYQQARVVIPAEVKYVALNYNAACRYFVYVDDIQISSCYTPPAVYALAVTASPDSLGTVSGGGSYTAGDTATLSAVANPGCHFLQWSDGVESPVRTVVVTANASYTALFAVNTYALTATASPSNMGTVSGSGTYAHGTVATLEAVPSEGCRFLQWADGVENPVRTVTVTSDTAFTALFAAIMHTVEVHSSNSALGRVYFYGPDTAGGQVLCEGDGVYQFPENSALTFHTEAYANATFVQWSDGNTSAHRLLTLTSDTLITAIFQAIEGISAVQGAPVVVSPNPATDYVEVSAEGLQRVEVIDLSGRTLRTDVFECQGGCTQKLSLADLAPGAYYLRIIARDFSTVKKLVVL